MSARTRGLWLVVSALSAAGVLFYGYTAFWPEGMSGFWRKTGSVLLLVAAVICVLAGLVVGRRDAKEGTS